MGSCMIAGQRTPGLKLKADELMGANCTLKVKMQPSHLFPKESEEEHIEEIFAEEQTMPADIQSSSPDNSFRNNGKREATLKQVSFFMEGTPPSNKPTVNASERPHMLKSVPSSRRKRPSDQDSRGKMFKSSFRSKCPDLESKNDSNSDANHTLKDDEVISQNSRSMKKSLRSDGIYEGPYVDGKKCGLGKEQFPDGSVYEGSWRNNKIHGRGRMTWSDGDWYEGEWYDGVENGEGVKHDAHLKSTSKGIWMQGILQGHVRIEWEDGSAYEGNFHGNRKNGHGRIEFKDGSYYEGNFLNDEIHGVGKYHWPNNRTYVGEWLHNQMSGQGTLTYHNGSEYKGEFQMNRKHGEGEFVWPDGKRYIGSWFRGKQHGRGTLITSKGEEKVGEWCQGKRVHEPSSHKLS